MSERTELLGLPFGHSETAARERTAPREGRAIRVGRVAARSLVAAASLGLAGWLIARTGQHLAGNKMAPWILGRATGVCAYLLFAALVLLGLLLSHPWRARVSRPSAANRIRAHIGLSVFTLGFTALHVFVLATDKYAGVGWSGALVPMGSTYRPVATTLGLLGVWTALLAGVSAAAAGRLPRRLWWPLHKVAASSFVLIWIHGVLGGGDTPALLALYLSTGALLVLVAVSRYAARTPSDRVAELRR